MQVQVHGLQKSAVLQVLAEFRGSLHPFDHDRDSFSVLSVSAASSGKAMGFSGARIRKAPTFSCETLCSEAKSSVTVSPQLRLWQGPMPQRP